jgi:hypothetical protein
MYRPREGSQRARAFASKEAICKAAIEWWGDMGTSLYAASRANPDADPLDQLHRLLDIMAGLASRPDQPSW